MAVPNSKSDDALLKNLVPLNTLSDDQLGVLLSRVTVEKAKKGQYLFREGDTDHQNIYLLHGTIALLSGQKEMDLVSSGTQTARFALAHQLPRKHSAQARTAVTYVRIDSRMLSDMLARSHSASYEVSDIEQPSSGDWMSLLLQSTVFQQIPPANLQRVMMRMEEIQVSAGDEIIRQGDEGDYFYLISQGECSVTRSPEAGHAPVELAKLHVGKGFGEEALISEKPRSSSVTMLTDGVLVRLNKQDFIQLVKQPLSRTVSYETACEEVEGGALWLDVRTPEEYEAGHLPGAINLPFFSLRFQASSLTMDRPYMVYGTEVGQSATASYLLTERGAEVFVLDIGWAELEEVAGLGSKAKVEAQSNNVIDFNRDAEDPAAEARLELDAQRHEIEKLKHELTEAQASFDEELKQRQTEVKLLKQALTVAKERADGEGQQAGASEALKQELETLRESLSQAEAQLAEATDLKQQLEKSLAHSADLESRLTALQEKLEQTRSLGDDFRQQGMKLQTQLKELQERRESQEGLLKEEITELRMQLESAGEAQQQVTQKEGELEKLKAELAALEESSEAYRQQAADDLARLTAERFELESAQHQLQEQLAAEQADEAQKVTALQQSLDEARAALESSQSDFQQRESALQAAVDDASKASTEALAQANSEIENLRKAGQTLQAQLDESQQRLVEAEEQSNNAKVLLQQQIDTLQHELQQQESSRQLVLQEKVGLEEQLEKSTAHSNELGNQVQALEERRHSLEKELESIRQAGNNAESQYNSAMTSLREDLEQSRQTIDELRQSRQQLEAALQQAQAQEQSQQQQLNEALAVASQLASEEQARLDTALAELNQELEAARNETRQQRDKRIEIEALLEQEHQTAAFLQRSLKTAEEAVEVSDNQYTEAEQSRKDLETQLSKLQQTLEQLQGDQGGLQQSLEQVRQEKAELEQSLEQARSTGQDEQQQKAQTAEALASAEQQLAELRTELQQLQAERDGEQNQQQAALEALRQELGEQQAAVESVQSEREAERQALQAQLSEVQNQLSSQSESLSADIEAGQQEIQQLREALKAAQAVSEAAPDQTELEAAQTALREAQEQIALLKRETEGLREVQIEMESQLGDDADAEILQLRGALEAEEQKRRKAEQQAQQADVLRREREVQETAIEMLSEDVDSLGKEKEELTAERDKLLSQLREIRVQYTDLVNENDQLHSEMSGFSGQASDSHLADDLLSQMEELRHKADRYEKEREQARSDAARMRREVGELRSVIETYVEQIQDVQSFGADEQVMALRTELDMVRRQAHDDLEQMRVQLQEAESRLTGMDSRDVDFVADQQAVRQEMVSLQTALNEKDHLLRLSQNQCRSLEDAVEDRDKEVDQLKRKLELLLRKTGGLDDPSARQGSRNSPDSQQREEQSYGLGDDNDSKKSGLGRLFRKK
jgi:chromosome segregation ATPase/CRP-like cAMP-binding protein